jgi:hypothetical protein
MKELKENWARQEPAVRYGSAAAAVVVSLFVVVQILPVLVAAMGLGLFLAILFVPYWLPTIIAFKRDHPSKGAIAAINFLFGWTFIGWVLSLVWALSDNGSRNHQSVVVNNHVEAMSPPPAAPTFHIGDVVNGHQFTGTAWVPLPPASPVPPPIAPPVPTQAQPAQLDSPSRTTP